MNAHFFIPIAALGVACGGAAGPDVSDRHRDLIAAESPSALWIEVDFVREFQPRSDVGDRIEERLGEVVNKSQGIFFDLDRQLSPRGSDYAWTDGELLALAAAEEDEDFGASSIAIHALVVDGHSSRDTEAEKVFGIAFGSEHIVVFGETIEIACAADLVSPERTEELCEAAELGVWTHQLGHVLGLVDNGVPMVEAHQDGGGHDTNSDCIMHASLAQSGLVNALAADMNAGLAGEAPGFGSDCRADLAAVRNSL